MVCGIRSQALLTIIAFILSKELIKQVGYKGSILASKKLIKFYHELRKNVEAEHGETMILVKKKCHALYVAGQKGIILMLLVRMTTGELP